MRATNMAKSFESLAPGQQMYWGSTLIRILAGPFRPLRGHAGPLGEEQLAQMKPALPTTRDPLMWIEREDGYKQFLLVPREEGFFTLDKKRAKALGRSLTSMVDSMKAAEGTLDCSEHKAFRKVLHSKGEDAAHAVLAKRGASAKTARNIIAAERRMAKAVNAARPR